MRYRYHTLDVFTTEVFGGNPLAVLPDARGLTDAQMQRTANELNLSETVFVFPPGTPEGTRKVRIFTPAAELPFAGHPTIGTAILLATLGAGAPDGDATMVVLEENVGPVRVRVRGEPGRPKFAQLSAAMLPGFRDAPPREEVAAMLGLSPDDLPGGDWEPATVSCGVPFLFVPLRTLDALGRAWVDRARWDRTMADAGARMVYPVVPEPGEAGVDFRARMYAPEAGIVEDPATGGAAAAFAGYLARRAARTAGARDAALRWTVRQGVEMGRPSTLYLEADLAGGEITAVRVGGSAVLVGEGEMEIPDLREPGG